MDDKLKKEILECIHETYFALGIGDCVLLADKDLVFCKC